VGVKINESENGFALALWSKPHYEFCGLNAEKSQLGDMSFRRLLKDVSTGLYYDGKDGWTSREADAFDFKDSQQAIKAFQKLDKDTLHLVLKFPDSRMDVSHPLGDPNPPRPKLGPDTPLIITTLLPAALQAVHMAGRMIS
jgi:hypothetical protein